MSRILASARHYTPDDDVCCRCACGSKASMVYKPSAGVYSDSSMTVVAFCRRLFDLEKGLEREREEMEDSTGEEWHSRRCIGDPVFWMRGMRENGSDAFFIISGGFVIF